MPRAALCVCDWCAPFLNEISPRLTGNVFASGLRGRTWHLIHSAWYLLDSVLFHCILNVYYDSTKSHPLWGLRGPNGDKDNRKSSLTLLPLWFYSYFFLCIYFFLPAIRPQESAACSQVQGLYESARGQGKAKKGAQEWLKSGCSGESRTHTLRYSRWDWRPI